MTRKNYVDLAERLKAGSDKFSSFEDYAEAVGIAADFFAADNARFDRERFLDAALPSDLAVQTWKAAA